MKTAGFGSLLWRGFTSTALPVAGFYGLIITVASLSGGLKTISLTPFWLAVIGALFIFSMFTFAASALIAFRAGQATSPRVRVARNEASGSHSYLICLLDSSPSFAVGMAVSFFITDQNGFEVQIGMGEVATIQENGQIQVALRAPAAGYEEVVNKLANNEKATLEAVRVRPFVSAAQIPFQSLMEANR